MNRIDEKFIELKKQNRAALMPYLPLGYPTMATSQELIRTIADAGADMIELGVPFSDPLADGPVIQHATQVALNNGITLAKCLAMARAAREAGVTIPLIAMGYANPILRYGVEQFARDAKHSGIDGLIVPDLPPEEAGEFDAALRAHDLALIFLASPTSTPERLQKIANASRGFIYLVSVLGVTGARTQIAADLDNFVARVRTVTDKPVCVGFGIANAESAHQVAQIADGVIVGSALVNQIGNGDAIHAAQKFVRDLHAAVNQAKV